MAFFFSVVFHHFMTRGSLVVPQKSLIHVQATKVKSTTPHFPAHQSASEASLATIPKLFPSFLFSLPSYLSLFHFITTTVSSLHLLHPHHSVLPTLIPLITSINSHTLQTNNDRRHGSSQAEAECGSSSDRTSNFLTNSISAGFFAALIAEDLH